MNSTTLLATANFSSSPLTVERIRRPAGVPYRPLVTTGKDLITLLTEACQAAGVDPALVMVDSDPVGGWWYAATRQGEEIAAIRIAPTHTEPAEYPGFTAIFLGTAASPRDVEILRDGSTDPAVIALATAALAGDHQAYDACTALVLAAIA